MDRERCRGRLSLEEALSYTLHYSCALLSDPHICIEECGGFAADPERSSIVLTQAACLPVSKSDKSKKALGSGLIRLS